MIHWRLLLAFLVVLATTPAMPADAGPIANFFARIGERANARQEARQTARYNAACAAQAQQRASGGSASSGGNYGETVVRYETFTYGDGGSASSGLNTGAAFKVEKPKAAFFPRLRTCPVGVDCGASVESCCPCGPDCDCINCDCETEQVAFACPVVDEPDAFSCSVMVERPGPFVCRVPSGLSVEAVASL